MLLLRLVSVPPYFKAHWSGQMDGYIGGNNITSIDFFFEYYNNIMILVILYSVLTYLAHILIPLYIINKMVLYFQTT